MSSPLPPLGCRQITLHERYSVTRANAGFPPIVTIVTVYPNLTSLPSLSYLSTRITTLQAKFPLLSAQPQCTRTSNPYWISHDAWTPEQIIHETTHNVTPGVIPGGVEDKAELIRKEIEIMEETMVDGIEQVPLWRVTRYTSSNGQGLAYLAVSVSHVLADGIGSLRLSKLLTLTTDEELNSIPSEEIQSIPRVEQGINVKPSMSFIIPLAARELLLPLTPSFIQNYFQPPLSWPLVTDVKSKPTTCPERFSLLEIPAEFTVPLKVAAKKAGVKTIHPILMTALSVAAWSVHTPGQSDIIYQASSPRSERNKELGHSFCTSNYVSSYETHLSIKSTDDFWSLALASAKQMNDPTALDHARFRIGSLLYIPDKPTFTSTDPRRPTGWENFFLNKAEGEHPYATGFSSVSNLGLTEIPPNATDLYWAHSPTPFSQVYSASVIGTVKGISMVLGWRDQSVITKEEVQKVEKFILKIFKGLIEDGRSSTVADLVGLN